MSIEIEPYLEAQRVVEHDRLGLFCTVDELGIPYARWMGGVAAEGLRKVYTLTGRRSRKVNHIRRNRHVSWVFSSPRQEDVVTLRGLAQLRETEDPIGPAWGELVANVRRYVMGPLSDPANEDFIVIETRVDDAELLSPRLKIYHPLTLDLPPLEG